MLSMEATTQKSEKEPLLKVEHLKTYFFTEVGVVKAVEDVSFHVNRGEIIGLCGESGCGKSVSALSIMKLVRIPGKIMSGKVLFKGQNLLELDENELNKIRGKEITMIFQDPSAALDPIRTVGEQIAEVAMLHLGLDEEEAKELAIETMKSVGIPEAEKRFNDYPFTFSGGMKQRIVIARAIVCKPSLLIADEPTTALDVTIQAQILELLQEMRRKYNMGMILITHNLGVVAENCDRVYIMYGGYIVEGAKTETIFQEPRHPYTRSLLKAIPMLGVKKDRLDIIPGSVPDLIDPPTGCRFHPRCAFATERCMKEVPKLEKIDDDHYVACFHPQYDPL